jgi:hypothetical protein
MRKDSHLWAIGGRGGLIVLVNNEGATDTILYVPIIL